MSTATVNSKGQITLPKNVRDYLLLSSGDRVNFVLTTDGGCDLIPIKSSVQNLKGCVPVPERAVTAEAMAKTARARCKVN